MDDEGGVFAVLLLLLVLGPDDPGLLLEGHLGLGGLRVRATQHGRHALVVGQAEGLLDEGHLEQAQLAQRKQVRREPVDVRELVVAAA